MIRIVRADEAEAHGPLLDEAYRLRHRVFAVERGWHSLARPDNRDRDDLDSSVAVHFLAMRAEQLAGYARLMPPEGLVPDLLTPEKREALTAYTGILGIGRMCVTPELRGGPKARSVAAELFLAICEHALAEGHAQLFAETDPAFLILLRLAGFKLGFIGRPADYHGRRSMLAIIALERRVLAHCWQVLKLTPLALGGVRDAGEIP